MTAVVWPLPSLSIAVLPHWTRKWAELPVDTLGRFDADISCQHVARPIVGEGIAVV